jgi:hypothetical protein
MARTAAARNAAARYPSLFRLMGKVPRAKRRPITRIVLAGIHNLDQLDMVLRMDLTDLPGPVALEIREEIKRKRAELKSHLDEKLGRAIVAFLNNFPPPDGGAKPPPITAPPIDQREAIRIGKPESTTGPPVNSERRPGVSQAAAQTISEHRRSGNSKPISAAQPAPFAGTPPCARSAGPPGAKKRAGTCSDAGNRPNPKNQPQHYAPLTLRQAMPAWKRGVVAAVRIDRRMR